MNMTPTCIIRLKMYIKRQRLTLYEGSISQKAIITKHTKRTEPKEHKPARFGGRYISTIIVGDFHNTFSKM